MIVPCPHCQAPYDTSNRLSGDAIYCSACGQWSTVRHQDGGRTVLTKRDEPPVSWPRIDGRTRRP
jgi:predicted amidophosphoribosyltransferase